MSHQAPDHEPVSPERVRALPQHFAWVDHRLPLHQILPAEEWSS